MGNLVLYYGDSKAITKIVNKYQSDYQARTYKIEPNRKITFFDKFKSVYLNENISVKKCEENLKNYETIILISELWFDRIPLPVIRFLEQQTGKVNKIIYVLYNKNKDDKQEEFDRMDRILNLRREKSYFVTLEKNDIHVRVYQ